MTHCVLLYYQFTPISSPESFAHEHRLLCESLGLRGRILIASEGLNGTVSGLHTHTDVYRRVLHADKRFADMDFKKDSVPDHVFPRLSIKVRKEVVSLHWSRPLDVNRRTGTHLEPHEFLRRMGGDIVLLDVRNRFEYDMGHFENAINPPVRSFREFPAWVEASRAELEGKPILTYCTGGIRCEKFTAFLLEAGFRDVFQLRGGIDAYRKDPQTHGARFLGECFVFDSRLSVPVSHNRTVLTTCLFCGVKSVRWLNCANLDCHRPFYACETCERENFRSCSNPCQQSPRHEYRIKGNSLFSTSLTERGLFSNPEVAAKYK